MKQEDGEEDSELKLQRDSTALIHEIQHDLPRFLWKSTGSVRRLVRAANTQQLINLLEPFQEEPQLLDRHLSKLTQYLVDAYQVYITAHVGEYHRLSTKTNSSNLIPLPRAICKLLYVLCKVRGHKVISQLLSKEPQHLQRMLDAFESWDTTVGDQNSDCGMIWEERYVMLLWVSHLLLAPFDLASMSSPSRTRTQGSLSSPELPDECPLIAKRLAVISCRYIGSATKAREAVVMLLVRLVLRPDMQNIKLHRIVLSWALRQLNIKDDPAKMIVDFTFLGLLSFVASFVSSAATVVLRSMAEDILQLAQQVEAKHSSSATARTLMIKLYRGLALHCIKAHDGDDDDENEGLLSAINFLMEQLAVNETVVRFAASKALAKISSQVSEAMAMDILEDILADLKEDTIESEADLINKWELPTFTEDRFLILEQDKENGHKSKKCDLKNVNAPKWHGLILTLSYFVYQRSVPATGLGEPIRKLIEALHFTQRNAVGSPVGTMVRDAACFGLWALARKFSTDEISSASAAGKRVLQGLACNLVVAATLDPEGNIRRAASAALQEMVGRHPNTIETGVGLELIQIVDFHAVASRKRAFQGVALAVSKIHHDYWYSLFAGLLSWRACRFDDVESHREAAAKIRQGAAMTMSRLAWLTEGGHMLIINALRDLLKSAKFTHVAERHGILWTLALVIDPDTRRAVELTVKPREVCHHAELDKLYLGHLWSTLYVDADMSSGEAKEEEQRGRRSLLTLEAQAVLLRVLAVSATNDHAEKPCGQLPPQSASETNMHLRTLTESITRLDKRTSILNSMACGALLAMFGPHEGAGVNFFITCIEQLSRMKGSQRIGLLMVLALTFHQQPPSVQDQVVGIIERETRSEDKIDLGSFSVQLLPFIFYTGVCTPELRRAIQECLSDYTIDKQRGDIGSHVRMEAIDTATVAINKALIPNAHERGVMIAKICGLAVERLDKVRYRAAKCLRENSKSFGLDIYVKAETPDISQINTIAHFSRILSLTSMRWARTAILEGFVTAAGNAPESLMQASRTALIRHASQLSQGQFVSFYTSLVDLFQDHTRNDRLLIPAMDVVAFLFEAGVTLRLEYVGFNWNRLFSLVEQAHLNSRNTLKIEIAIRIYCGLAQVEKANDLPIRKLCRMLTHSYPNIRNAAADALLLATGISQDLVEVNWKRPRSELSGHVAKIREQLGIGPLRAQA